MQTASDQQAAIDDVNGHHETAAAKNGVEHHYKAAESNLRAALPSVASVLQSSAVHHSGKALRGKVVVVTGAASGFGRAYALKAASLGAKVVLSDLLLNSVLTVKREIHEKGGKAVAIACDVTKWKDQVQMFKFAVSSFGPIDVVVANAGITEKIGWMNDDTLPNGDPKEPNMSTLQVNLIGAAFTVKLAFFYLRQNKITSGKKSIVMLGSMSSFFAIPSAPMYSAAKHGCLGLFRSVYNDADVEGINCNIVCPWFTPTPLLTLDTKVAISGLPLATVDNVVSAMIRSSDTTEVWSGNAISVDASGMLAIPFDADVVGPNTYYFEFSKRAVLSMRVAKTAKDIAAAILSVIPAKAGLLALLGAALAIRHRRNTIQLQRRALLT